MVTGVSPGDGVGVGLGTISRAVFVLPEIPGAKLVTKNWGKNTFRKYITKIAPNPKKKADTNRLTIPLCYHVQLGTPMEICAPGQT